MSGQPSPAEEPVVKPVSSRLEKWVTIASWGLVILMVGLMVAMLALRWRSVLFSNSPLSQGSALAASEIHTALPEFTHTQMVEAIVRQFNLHTIIPERPREEAIDYTVDKGDSVFSIAGKFGLKPETILWANYDVLNDNPDMLSPGQTLTIPPVNGVYYKWQEGDTFKSVAGKFSAKLDDILTFTGNRLDLANPQVNKGEYVMVPGGHREFKQWLVPTIPTGRAGVSSKILGPGGCDAKNVGVYGSGAFIWPTVNHFLSGNDYGPAHLGIDIAGALGDLVHATDSGMVVYAGSIGGGYGNMVMIDHGNGYQTLYAHLSAVNVRCGQGVGQGQLIGQVGSTGNSTGAHLHFEVRYMGGFIDPWYVLP